MVVGVFLSRGSVTAGEACRLLQPFVGSEEHLRPAQSFKGTVSHFSGRVPQSLLGSRGCVCLARATAGLKDLTLDGIRGFLPRLLLVLRWPDRFSRGRKHLSTRFLTLA